MAADPKQIQDILAALGKFYRVSSTPHVDADAFSWPPAQQPPPASTPTQTPPNHASAYPPPQSMPPGSYAPPGAASYLPAPASSGNLDLSSIRPVNSGTLNFDDVMSKIRASAVEKGVTPYDRPLVYNSDSRGPDRSYGRDRSRSPYRDDRRGGSGGGGGVGHGREYGRDRSYSPGPRGRQFSPRGNGNGRVRSPLRSGDDEISETIQIESSLVGLIIGRQGENLRRIEADTNCRVQFLPATDGGPFRHCKISGARNRRTEVKDAINRIIEDSGMGPLNRAHDKPRDPSKGGAAALRDGEDHMQIMVPDRTVGLIIGRGGETIRDLQERSGCHINIVGESKSVNGLRPVNLIGTHEAAQRAKDSIMEIVDSDSRGEGLGGGRPPPSHNDAPRRDAPSMGGGHDKINDAIYVPSDAVGMIIGKGGETIRDMQSSTGCKINVAQSSGPGETEREIALIGSHDSIARAKQAIQEKVEAVVSLTNPESCVHPKLTAWQRQKSGPGGGRGGRGGHDQDRSSYSHQGSSHSTNQAAQAPATDSSDPYAQCRFRRFTSF
jgi:far upstream element-binding protein